MSFDSRVYRILIGSPSDVEEERDIAVRVIQEWNDLHSYTRKVVLLPLRWETHTAPDYGTRPQEVINQAIVDQCDLLVGIFWTRIGSNTGKAESGTLEEIERVGHAGKPIMLYFSKVGIDPGVLDLGQVERLTQFKAKTYPKALTESYKSLIDFRDKFAKQLELKIRELQQADNSGPPPLELSFLAADTGKLLGNMLTVPAKLPVITDLEAFRRSVGKEAAARASQIVFQRVKETLAIPTVLTIRNASSFGVRDLYVEISIATPSQTVQVAESIGRSRWSQLYTVSTRFDEEPSPIETAVTETLAHFEEEGLSKEGDGWKLAFEWGALQPQRMRLVKPVLFVIANESTSLDFTARLFADGFAEPLAISAQLKIVIERVDTTVEELVPDIKAQLAVKPPVMSGLLGNTGFQYVAP